jgi:predicted lipid-binding transport protein (Tim44 family)
MRRLLTALVLLTLLHAPEALARAGGGSSSYGGGGGFSGGGGGGGGFSGGAGAGAGGAAGGGFGVVLIFVIIAFVVGSALLGLMGRHRWRRRRDARVAQIRLAAAEAASDDAAFDADGVVEQARDLFLRIQSAWTARDRDALARIVSPTLLAEWRLRLDDFDRRGWHNQVTVAGTPAVHYVGLVNRESDDEDRVVVLVEAQLVDIVLDRHGNRIRRSNESDVTAVREYWTLGKRDGRWALLSIEQLAEGEHHLSDAPVASPWGDDRLRDEALVERAVAEAAPADADVGSLVDLDFAGDGRRAALDLSLVDGRFAPDVLEAAARRALAGWAEAVDGADDALLAVATPAATTELLYPRGDQAARLVVRGPRLERMTLVALDGQADPPRMVVELALSGRRYVEDRNTIAVLEGSREAVARWTERWTFALDGADQTPWRVVGATESAIGRAV